jgi:hypothetical protein
MYDVPDWVYSSGPFSLVPLQPSEIAQFFGNDKLGYDVFVEVLYPIVHPKIKENIDGSIHTFINLVIIPELLLDYDALCLLDLKPLMSCLQLLEGLASDRSSLVEAGVHFQALDQYKVLMNFIYTFGLRERMHTSRKSLSVFHASELPRQLSFLR